MKAIAVTAALAVIGSAVAYGFLAGNDDRQGRSLDPKSTAVEKSTETKASLAAAESIPEPEPEVEMEIIDPFLVGKRTTAPALEELTYETPIVQYHADRSVTTHKLARLTLPDGTVREIPVRAHARLAPQPMELKSRAETMMFLREERGEDFGQPMKPKAGEADKPLNSGTVSGDQ
ncbi:MAG: hypothetical protein WD226_03605 [Planctomycetota bacterium]